MAHPVMLALVRAKTRQALRSQGYSLRDAIELASVVDDNILDVAISQAPQEVQAKVGEVWEFENSNHVRAIGDGSFLKFITDFLSSELGKTLIALILSLIGA